LVSVPLVLPPPFFSRALADISRALAGIAGAAGAAAAAGAGTGVSVLALSSPSGRQMPGLLARFCFPRCDALASLFPRREVRS
jgi:hypothetical protein